MNKIAMDDPDYFDNNNDDELKTCVVLGGRGFIGRSLVLRLLRLGNWIVRVADSTQSPQLDPSSESLLAEAFSSGRASYFHVDVRHKSHIIKAVEGASVVFYMDTTVSYPPDFYVCYTIIVQGAKNVINACRECKVKQLIYNSSADVVFDNGHDIFNGDESLPYAGKLENMLEDLKAQAEALVLFANDVDGLLTCALRPTNVFGPGDKQLVPSLVNMAKSGWAKFILGSGESMCDFTFVENVAHAFICAEEALSSRMVSASGKAFFITNIEPVKFSEFVCLVLEGLGYRRPMINLPAGVVRYIMMLIKSMHLNMDYGSVHKILKVSSCTRTFNCSAAQKHIGYSPVVSLQEGIALTIESFSHLAKDSSFMRYSDFDEQSKVEKLLGGGKVADILLWRDEKKTFTCFLFVVVLYYWFFLCGRTFIASAAKLLLLILGFLCAYSFLPSRFFGFRIPRVLSTFEISEMGMSNCVSTIAYMWNRVSSLTKSLAQGEDWHTFFKVAALLYFTKLIVSHSLTMAVGVALILAFTLFLVYEQYEEEIDGAAAVTLSIARMALRSLIKNLPVPFTSHLNREMLHDDASYSMLKSHQ